jgi:flagellar hook-length control protein FliK
LYDRTLKVPDSATATATASAAADADADADAAAAVPVTGGPSPVPAEAADESSADEAPGSKPVGAAAPGHDRFSSPGLHPGGPLSAGVGHTGEGPANPSPVQHPPVVDQVVSVVEPLRQRGEGHHELTLDLRPADLGPIRVEVSIEQGTVHLSLHADQPSTGALLHQAMPELRAALEEAGLVAGRLGVGSGDREGGRPPAQFRPTEADEPKAVRTPAAAVAAIRPSVAPAAGALDVLL